MSIGDASFDGNDLTGILGEKSTFRTKVEGNPAFELAELLDAAIDRQREPAVLDLSELEFMKPSDSKEVDNVERRLAVFGVRLTSHLPAELVNRLLELVERRDTTPEFDHNYAGGSHDPTSPTMTAPGTRRSLGRYDSMRDLRKVTSLPTDPDVIDGVLRLVVELTRAMVRGADGVSVSLLRHGRLSTVAASDQTIMDMDADQYATDEGPCVDASRQGHPFHAAVLAGETRWPTFTPQALGLGINAILSSPLKAFDKPVGALNIYSRTPLAFDSTDQVTAASFAEKASVILSDAGVGVTDDEMDQRYQEALRSRRVINLATGVVMEREGMDEDQAFSALLRLSLYHGETLRERAETMVHTSRQSEPGPLSDSDSDSDSDG
jgi:ANTAR domain/GAF domain